jgi:hypothetical protein
VPCEPAIEWNNSALSFFEHVTTLPFPRMTVK